MQPAFYAQRSPLFPEARPHFCGRWRVENMSEKIFDPSISGFCKRNDVGKTFTYGEIKAGRLEAHKVGSRTKIFPEAEERWKRALPKLVTGKAPHGG